MATPNGGACLSQHLLGFFLCHTCVEPFSEFTAPCKQIQLPQINTFFSENEIVGTIWNMNSAVSYNGYLKSVFQFIDSAFVAARLLQLSLLVFNTVEWNEVIFFHDQC